MGIGLWTGCAAVVFLSARSVPLGRPGRWIWELIEVLLADDWHDQVSQDTKTH